MRNRSVLFKILSAAMLLLLAAPARAEDRYFLLMFGWQSKPKQVRHTHTFATFVHARGEGPRGEDWQICEVVTISWMPESLRLRPLLPIARRGVNLDLHSSLDFAVCEGVCISMWGPYEICPALFDMAVARQAYLESGIPREALLNRGRRPDVLNCIQAINGIDHSRGRLHTRFAAGDIASYYDLHHFDPYILQPGLTHDWVGERLGVFLYPIRRRGFCEVPQAFLPIFPPRYSRD